MLTLSQTTALSTSILFDKEPLFLLSTDLKPASLSSPKIHFNNIFIKQKSVYCYPRSALSMFKTLGKIFGYHMCGKLEGIQKAGHFSTDHKLTSP